MSAAPSRRQPLQWIALSTCVLAATVIGAITAFACGAAAIAEVNPTSAPPGAIVTVTGMYFYPPGAAVAATFSSGCSGGAVIWSGTVPPAPSTSFAFPFRVPNEPPSAYCLTLTATSNGRVLGRAPVILEITPSPTPAPTPSPSASAAPNTSPASLRPASGAGAAPRASAPANPSSAAAKAPGSAVTSSVAAVAPMSTRKAPQSRAATFTFPSVSARHVAAFAPGTSGNGSIAVIAGAAGAAAVAVIAVAIVSRRAIRRWIATWL